MENRTDTEIVRAYDKLSDYLIDRIMRPKSQILDNEASQAMQREICTRHCDFQLVTPHMPRRNASERDIRTFKNNFVSGLCSARDKFPVHLWCRLIPQSTLTLKLLQTSRLNIQQPSEEQLNVTFNFNRVPLAPPGTKIIVHKKPIQRSTWAPHGVNGWYLVPEPLHYSAKRNFHKTLLLSTGAPTYA